MIAAGPTIGMLIESCRHNAEVARYQVRRVREELSRLPIGEGGSSIHDLNRYLSDCAHWSDYVLYWQRRGAIEGFDTVPAAAFLPAVSRPRRLKAPREVGADDDDEQPTLQLPAP